MVTHSSMFQRILQAPPPRDADKACHAAMRGKVPNAPGYGAEV